MRRIDSFVVILLSGILLIVLFLDNPNSQNDYVKPEVEHFFLTKHSSIRTNDPNDTCFSDLSFLATELRDKRIVLIGEQQHGDGATYLMKIRLLKYLHLELGYNIVITESNTFDTYLLNELLKKDEKEADLNIAYYPFWAQTRESQQFENFLIENRDSINLYGFDIQPSGTKEDLRYRSICDYIKQNDSTLITKYDKLFSILPRISMYRYSSYSEKFSDIDKSKMLAQVDSLTEKLFMFEESEEKQLLIRFFFGLKGWLSNIWFNEEDKQVAYRDSLMARNCIYLLDSIIKDGKIIILSANSHLLYNECGMKNNYKRFGSYLKDKYKNNLFCILTTSFDGYTGMLYKNDSIRLNQSGKSSVERIIHKLNQKFLYYSFKEADKIRDNYFSLKCLGHNNHSACWMKMCDGLIYIDNLTPMHYD